MSGIPTARRKPLPRFRGEFFGLGLRRRIRCRAYRRHPRWSKETIVCKPAADPRRRAHARAKKAIAARRTGQFQIALRLWIEQARWRADITPESRRLLAEPAREYFAADVGKLHRKVLKRGRKFGSLSSEERHTVRRALERLRNVVGFFPSALGKKKPRRHYERRLTRLPERRGRYNDMLAAEELVQIILKSKMAAVRRDIEALRDWPAFRENGEAG